MFDRTGFIDPHVPTAPDLVRRLLDDVSSVREAFKVSMAGILTKNHTTLTADRAALADQSTVLATDMGQVGNPHQSKVSGNLCKHAWTLVSLRLKFGGWEQPTSWSG